VLTEAVVFGVVSEEGGESLTLEHDATGAGEGREGRRKGGREGGREERVSTIALDPSKHILTGYSINPCKLGRGLAGASQSPSSTSLPNSLLFPPSLPPLPSLFSPPSSPSLPLTYRECWPGPSASSYASLPIPSLPLAVSA